MANNCSGLVPSPLPPISFGMASWRSSLPSALLACPSRPSPVANASAVYRVFIAVPFVVRCPGAGLADLAWGSRRATR